MSKTIDQLPLADTASSDDLLLVSQGGNTMALSVGALTEALGGTPGQGGISLTTASVLGVLSAGLPIAQGGTGATTQSGALTALGAYAATNPSGYLTSAALNGYATTSSVTAAISTAISALPGGSGSPEVALSSLPDVGTVTESMSYALLDASGNPGRATFAEFRAFFQANYTVMADLVTPVILTGDTQLNATTHKRRLLVATTALTLTAPAFSALGANFTCDVVNDAASGMLTFGTGISSSLAQLAPGQSTRIYCYNNGTANVIRALNGGSAAAGNNPTIQIAGPSGVVFVPSGSTTTPVAISGTLTNYSSAPTLKYILDGGSQTTLPNGTTVTQGGVTGMSLNLAGGVHSLVLVDSNGVPSNSLTITVESLGVSGVPSTGWQATQAKTLTGATTSLAGLSTAYAALWNGTSQVGARQPFTNSATLAALSFTPAAANNTTTLRFYDAATNGNLLAETAAFTVAAAPAAAPIFPPVGSVNTGGWTIHSNAAGTGYWHNFSASMAAGYVDTTGGGGAIWINHSDGTAPEAGGVGITAMTFGWTQSTASVAFNSAQPNTSDGGATHTNHGQDTGGGGVTNGNVNAANYYWQFCPGNSLAAAPSVAGTWYQVYGITGSDGSTSYAFCGPFTVTS